MELFLAFKTHVKGGLLLPALHTGKARSGASFLPLPLSLSLDLGGEGKKDPFHFSLSLFTAHSRSLSPSPLAFAILPLPPDLFHHILHSVSLLFPQKQSLPLPEDDGDQRSGKKDPCVERTLSDAVRGRVNPLILFLSLPF